MSMSCVARARFQLSFGYGGGRRCRQLNSCWCCCCWDLFNIQFSPVVEGCGGGGDGGGRFVKIFSGKCFSSTRERFSLSLTHSLTHTHTHTHTRALTHTHTPTHPPTHPHTHTHTRTADVQKVEREYEIVMGPVCLLA